MAFNYSFFHSNSRWYYPIRWSILVLLGLAIYYQTFRFDFVFDDDWFIVDNPYIRQFNQINNSFISLPLTRMLGVYSFGLNYLINGLNPMGYHIFNVIVHFIATGLVWGLSNLLFKIVGWMPFRLIVGSYPKKKAKEVFAYKLEGASREIPYLIALLFLAHPCQTQAVSYITQRFESIATVLYLATVYCYLLARVSNTDFRKVIFFILALICAVLGVLTKEVVATIPVTLIAAEWILFSRNKQGILSKGKEAFKKANQVLIYILLIAGGFLFSILFMKLVRTGLNIFLSTVESDSHDGDFLTPVSYFLTQMRVFLTFIRLLIFPVHQNLDYDYPMSIGILQPPLTLVGLLSIGFIIYLIFRFRQNLPLVSFGLAWVLITFSINLAPRANVIFEHKLYLISFGFFLAIVSALFVYIRSRMILLCFMACLVAVLSLLSFQRNHVWRNNVTLWEDIIQESPHKKRSNINLGLAYMRVGRYGEALTVFNKVMKPKDLKSYSARGEIYYELGKDDQALGDFNYVLSMDRDDFEVYIRRAKVYKRQMKYEVALLDLDRAILLQPKNERAYIDRGILWMAQGRETDAIKDFEEALRLDPSNYGALVDLAGVYIFKKEYERALEILNKAQGIKPNDFRVYKNRAFCFLTMGQVKEALKDMETSLRLNPNDVQMMTKHQEVLLLK